MTESDTQNQELTPIEAAVLLASPEWDAKLFAAKLAEDWEVTIPESEFPENPADPIAVEVNGTIIAIQLADHPIPAEMARMHAAMNPLWPQAGAMAQLHRAHLIVAAIPKTTSMVEAAQMLVKVVSSLCALPTALAVDTGSAIIGLDGYKEGAAVMKGGELPLFNLVTFAIAKTDEEHFVAFTMGMSFLGEQELEIRPTTEKPEVIQEFLYTVALYTLKTGRGVRDGQVLGLRPETSKPIEFADSQMIPGMKTMQITL